MNIIKTLTAVVFLGSISCRQENKISKKPNIIIFIADDAAWNDNIAYGHPSIQTPVIDMLAKGGMTFTNAFLTTSSCSPSRCSIMTGLYPHNTGAPELHMPLPVDRLIFPGELKKQGYYALAAGKWHLGPERNEFDSIFQPREASGSADWLRAVQNRPKDKPFFMWLASKDPHRPYEKGIIPIRHKNNEVIVPPFINDNDSTRKDLALYYDEIARLDSNIGKVINELKKQGVYENTVVIYMSDNGRPFPRCKNRMYDSGIKTPLVISWPNRIKAGSVSNSLVSSIDLAPTLCELAGAEIPEEFQGKSMLPLFLDTEAEIRDFIFAEHNWHDYQAYERAVRSKQYLYIKNSCPDLNATPPADAVRSITYQEMIRLYNQGQLSEEQTDCFVLPRNGAELYNVEKDPYQMNNLINEKEYREVVGEMAKILEQWKIETNDSMPSQLTPDMFDRWTGKAIKGIKQRNPADF